MSYINIFTEREQKDFASTWDELPLWSAPFGIKILDLIDYKKNINVLDIGCGTGFPLIEIAQRLGNSCECYGIDPWEAAINRLKEKISFQKINNIKLFDCKSEEMPFNDEFFDLIVSNNGINNTQQPELVLKECNRVAKNSAQLILSVNLPGTFSLFYETLTEVLLQLEHFELIELFINHINSKRKSVKENIELIENAGFIIKDIFEDNYTMKFTDGNAFFNHFFIKSNFAESWYEILNKTDKSELIIRQTELKLNEIANGSYLTMDVPLAVFNCFKP